jgi:hypothetical protein
MVWVREFAAVHIGQASQPGYEAARAGVLLARETDATVSPLNLPHVPVAPCESSRQTQAFRWACDGSSPNPGDSPRCRRSMAWSGSVPRTSWSTRSPWLTHLRTSSGTAAPTQQRRPPSTQRASQLRPRAAPDRRGSADLPGLPNAGSVPARPMDHGSPRSRGGGTRRGRAARPPVTCREEATEAVSPAAPRADSITEIRRCRLTLPYTSLPFIPGKPAREEACCEQQHHVNGCFRAHALATDRSGKGHV